MGGGGVSLTLTHPPVDRSGGVPYSSRDAAGLNVNATLASRNDLDVRSPTLGLRSQATRNEHGMSMVRQREMRIAPTHPPIDLFQRVSSNFLYHYLPLYLP
jgi:hypothetical protein